MCKKLVLHPYKFQNSIAYFSPFVNAYEMAKIYDKI